MLVYVECFSNTWAIRIDSHDSVLSVKGVVRSYEPIEVKDQLLLLVDRELLDEENVIEAGIRNATTLRVLNLRPPSMIGHLSQTCPVRGQICVPLEAIIGVRFLANARSVDPAQLFKVRHVDSGHEITGMTTYCRIRRVASFIPQFELAPHSNYDVTLCGEGILSRAGEGAQLAPYSFSFRTGGQAGSTIGLLTVLDSADRDYLGEIHQMIYIRKDKLNRVDLTTACARAFLLPSWRVSGFAAERLTPITDPGASSVFSECLEDDVDISSLTSDDVLQVYDRDPDVVSQMAIFSREKKQAIMTITMIRSLHPGSALWPLPNELLFEIFYHL